MHPGQGPGLSLHDLGETGGSETVTLLESEIPSHQHALRADAIDQADTNMPSPATPARAVGAAARCTRRQSNTSLSPNAWRRPAATCRTTTSSRTSR